MAKKINSRNKGKRGELELSHILNRYGFDTRRGQQYCGANGDADVVGVPYLHIECKRVENLNLTKALQQAIADSKDEEYPAVFHRKNGEEWKVTLSLEDFLCIYSGFLRALHVNKDGTIMGVDENGPIRGNG